jgi:methylglutaconyl-CoA hydratase
MTPYYQDKDIIITTDQTSARITLTRTHKANAFNETMVDVLSSFINKLPATMHVVSMQAHGKVFSAGMDLSMMRKQGADNNANELSARKLAALFYDWYHLPCTTICFVQGACYGGAMGFAAGSDLVVASDQATFCCPEVKHGLLPALIAPYLNHALGNRFATMMALHGEPVSAQLMYQNGFVSELIDKPWSEEIIEAFFAKIMPRLMTMSEIKSYNKQELPLSQKSILALIESRTSYAQQFEK